MKSEKKVSDKHQAQDVTSAGVIRAWERKAPTGGGMQWIVVWMGPVLTGVKD